MDINLIPGKEIESDVTLIGEGTQLRGEVLYARFTRIHGRVEGSLHGEKGSFLVIAESAAIHGDIHCDEVVIDGFVRGNVFAKNKATISRSGRLIGNVKSPHFEVQFGAHFEGKATTSRARGTSEPSVEDPSPAPSMA